jgi:hypothetical protein
VPTNLSRNFDVPENRDEIVKVLPGQEGHRRVAIVRRSDGFFELRPEKWYQNEWEGQVIAQGWAPTVGRSGVFETAYLAEMAAYFDYPWLRSRLH